jgi:hypothetical protein
MITRITLLITVTLLNTINSEACTIFSGKDKKGNIWAGNNEDFYFSMNSYLNVVARTDSTYGYIYLTHFSPGGFVQGGTNEAGLFFDGNAVYPSVYRNYDKKQDFPGAPGELLHHILKTCSSIPEVLDLFQKYRLQGLEAGQMHLADRHGNFGIIVADSMWLTKSDHQISTNYNLSHSNKDGIKCWRYPIAESILKNNEPGLETFTSICDSTSRKTRYSTVYSNIHNLSTGDIWFFFGMDYERPYHTNIKILLKDGTRSFFWSELFQDRPLVMAFNTYRSEGAEKSLELLDKSQLSTPAKTEVMRLMVQDLIHFNRDFNAYPILEAYIRNVEKPDDFNMTLNAISLFCLDRKDEALNILGKFISENPGAASARETLAQISGTPVAGANVRFELAGFENAKCVFIDGLSISPVNNFLVRQGNKWTGSFRLPANEYHYNFLVDGMRVLDPDNYDIVRDGNTDYNRIIVGN